MIEVRVVNVEVVVEDRKGNRIEGLSPEDFQLWVDGELREISFFNEIQQGKVGGALGYGSPEEVATPSASGNFSGARLGTSYLVFIDNFFTRGQERNRTLKGIRSYVSRLGPEDRMAIVAFDGRRLEMLTSWNQSAEELQEILRQAETRKAFGYLAATDRRQASLSSAVLELERQLETMSKAVTATLRSFANPPGRKVMLLAAGKWPFSPRRFASGRSLLFEFDRGEEIFNPIHETANLLGYTLYPIDVSGITTTGPDASQRGPGAGFDFTREDETHQTFRVLARETGGLALLDGGRIDSLDRVVSDTRSYYWLGFIPEWRGDDRDHEIRVEVQGRKLRLRHREGYRDLSRAKEVSFATESALLFGEVPPGSELEVALGEPTRRRLKTYVPLELRFPMDQITVLRAGGVYSADLELRIAALDERGYRSDLDTMPLRISGSALPKPGAEGVQEVSVALRRRPQNLIVSLYDPLSGAVMMSKVAFQP